MLMNYERNKGVFVGKFNEDDLRNKKDKIAIKKAMEETGLQYIHSEYVKSKGEVVALKVYVCELKDSDFFS